MDRDAYLPALRRILDTRTADVTARLRRVAEVAAGPDGAGVQGIVVDVFPDQDGEGTFDVWVRFEGPDFFALNKPIDDVRHLFGVVHTEDGLEPEVPEPYGGGTAFDPGEAIVEVVTAWIEEIWVGVGSAVPLEVLHAGD
ncbi:DUF6389 family protein [Pimelobacter sp. 30-1]|uniref:DUF6389 family protein n=1 Tax=Pimelobacter sp. 30-1 TaxID=2004991 RepID=UPI001C04BDC1|nr:DUF6389 family protein [Pimelobacter sp. 30-1]MBU2694376.1 hypothetical protein [Pimelobacter sp. 30-1]